MVALITVFIIFVVLGGYFAGSESSYSAMNKMRIKSKADEGNKKAKNAMYIANNFDRALTALLIGNNITHIAAASVATVFMKQLYEQGKLGSVSDEAASVYCTFITTGIVFLFSEMIPKSFANDRSDTLALMWAGSLRVLMKILTPLVAFFTLITNFASKLFSVKATPSITEEELYDIIDIVEEEGVMDEAQSDMLKSAMDFSETTAADVMTMRQDIVGIDINLSTEEILDIVKNSTHTRLPVYDGDLDNLLGTLQIRQFLKEYLKNPKTDIHKMLVPPHYVSREAKINDLLTDMRQHKIYIACVGDALKLYGIVTIEDFLEELVGEIWDEDDVVDNTFIKLGGNRFLVSTKLTVGDVFERLGYIHNNHDIDTKPMLSWIIETFGHFPEEEESFTIDKLEVSVETIDNHKITEVIIRIKDEDVFSDGDNSSDSGNNGKTDDDNAGSNKEAM